MWRLLGVQGAYKGRFFDLTKDRLIIGSGAVCDIELCEDDCIAESHAELLLCNGNYVFRDLNTSCPSTLNGQVVITMTALNDGDSIQIGDSVFRLEQMLSGAPAKAGDFATTDAPGPSTRAPVLSSSAVTSYAASPRTLMVLVVVAVLVLLAGIAVFSNRNTQARQAQPSAPALSVGKDARQPGAGDDKALTSQNAQLDACADSAVESFLALDSRLSVGMSRESYTQELGNLKVALDKFGRTPGGEDHPAYRKLALAYNEYQIAQQTWELHGEDGFLRADSEVAKGFISDYGVKVPKGYWFIMLSDVLDAVWRKAGGYVAEAKALLNSGYRR